MRTNFLAENVKGLELVRKPVSPRDCGIEDVILHGKHDAFIYQSREISWDGLRLNSAKLVVNRPVQLKASSSDIGLAMHFQLSGEAKTIFCDRKFELLPEKQFVVEHSGEETTESTQVWQNMAAFQINISTTWYEERIASYVRENRMPCTSREETSGGLMNSTMTKIIREMMECPYQGSTRMLFLEGKVLELLASQIGMNKFEKEKHFSSYDIQALHYAREIIEKNFSNEITLKELARVVGINEFKLKKGFKLLFGTPVHAYLITMRMENALNLLREGHQVSQVCEAVGYRSLSYFVQAFKKRFGHTPMHRGRRLT